MKQTDANNMMQGVRTGYNRIAAHFAQTRSGQWQEVQHLAENLIQPGERILDVGCGNGRLADDVALRKGHYTGVDISDELVSIASSARPWAQFVTGSMTSLPLPDNTFDHIFAIASFHHLPGREMRIAGLNEMKRVLKPGGSIIMTNWNLHQWGFWRLRLKWKWRHWTGRAITPEGVRMESNDTLIPWKDQNRNVLAERYYHGFTKGEIRSLAREAGLKVDTQYYEYRGLHVPRRKGQNLITILEVR